VFFAAFFGPRSRAKTSRRALCPPPQNCISCNDCSDSPWAPPKFHAKILEAPPRRVYRGVSKPAGGRGELYVAALEEKEKTRRHAQTGPGRDMLLQLREEHAEGSRTRHLAGPETHCGNWQKLWLVKNKVGRPQRLKQRPTLLMFTTTTPTLARSLSPLTFFKPPSSTSCRQPNLPAADTVHHGTTHFAARASVDCHHQ
jgi:hypothetical protein